MSIPKHKCCWHRFSLDEKRVPEESLPLDVHERCRRDNLPDRSDVPLSVCCICGAITHSIWRRKVVYIRVHSDE